MNSYWLCLDNSKFLHCRCKVSFLLDINQLPVKLIWPNLIKENWFRPMFPNVDPFWPNLIHINPFVLIWTHLDNIFFFKFFLNKLLSHSICYTFKCIWVEALYSWYSSVHFVWCNQSPAVLISTLVKTSRFGINWNKMHTAIYQKQCIGIYSNVLKQNK